MQYTKGFIFLDMKLYLTTLLSVFMLVLSGCSSDDSNQGETNTFSGPLPKELKAIDYVQNTLIVKVVVDGGSERDCTGLTVDTMNGTYSCSITLPAGSYTLDLVFYVEGTFGTAQVMTVSGGNVTVAVGQTVPADFSTATSDTSFDDDGDGKTNLVEIDEGSDPSVTSYYIGGSVTGLVASGTGIVLQSDVGDDLTLTSDGDFNFVPAVADSTAYTVTILTPPSSPSQTCTVNGGSGTVSSADVTDIEIICPCLIGYSLIGDCILD